jgi:hypothetical protein
MEDIPNFGKTSAPNICDSADMGLGLMVRATGLHAGDPGSNLGRDGLYTFGYIPPAP